MAPNNRQRPQQHSPQSYMRLPMPLPLPQLPAVPSAAPSAEPSPAFPPSTADPSDESAQVSDDDDDDDDDEFQDAVPAPAVATPPAPVEQGPRMVSRAVQAGGVDQGTQVDFPCQRCVSSQQNNYYSNHQQQHDRYAAYPPYPPPPPYPPYPPYYYPPPQHAPPQWHHNHSMPPPAVQGQAQGQRLAPASHPPPPTPSRHPNPFLPAPGSTPQAPAPVPITPAPALPPGPMTWESMVLRRTWTTLEDAEEDIKNFAEFLGFALIRRRSGNTDPDTGKPTRIHYCCHLDAARNSHLERNPESRKRKRESATNTAKRDDPCPWQICLRWNRQRRDRPDLFRMWHLVWTTSDDPKFRSHNHPMDPDPANIPANRRRHMTQEVKDQILGFVHQGMSAADVVRAMKDANPRLKLTKSAVDNMRRADAAEKKKMAEEAAAAAEARQSGEGVAAGAGAAGNQAGPSPQATPAATTQATPATTGQGTTLTGATGASTGPEAMAVAAMAGLTQSTPSRPPRVDTQR